MRLGGRDRLVRSLAAVSGAQCRNVALPCWGMGGDPLPVALQAGQYSRRISPSIPGETIRTPRMLLIHWAGNDRMLGHNRMRRLIYEHYTPLLAGEKPIPVTQCNTWFPVGDDGDKVTADNQIELLQAYQPLGIEYLVTDAGWYGGSEWPKNPCWCFQVGNWEPRVDSFPQGLKPVGQAAQALGIKYGVWFEPERASFDTPLMREHPEWMIPQPDDITGGLLNLGLPEVQQWMIELVQAVLWRRLRSPITARISTGPPPSLCSTTSTRRTAWG